MPRSNTIEIIIRGEDKASGVLKKIGGGMRLLGKAAMIGVGAVATGAGLAGAAMAKLAIDAAPLEGIEEAFKGIAEASGKGADEMLAALEKGSAGMIAQRDLMKSYNLAAQLVGDQFANQLPQAMGFLGKVAAATGEDMGYMMDSLVRGVGRLSPMILDNLGIQVDLAAAYEAHAKQIDKKVDALTKEEQQTALMNQVMAKLAENTANMPEVAGTAAAGIAKLQAQFKNLKDQAGKALLPALTKIATILLDLSEAILPAVTNFMSGTVAPAIEKFANALTWAVDVIADLADEGTGLQEIVRTVISCFLEGIGVSDDLRASIRGLIDTVFAITSTLQDLADKAIGWVTQFVSWKDVLIALGIAIAAVVIPALIGIVSAAAPLVAAAVALIAVISLVRNAWENNWLGIRDKVQEVISFVAPLIQGFIADATSWFQANWPTIAAVILTVWETIKAAISSAVQVIVGQAWPPLQAAIASLSEAMAKLGIDWSDVWGALGQAVKIVAYIIGAAILGIIGVITGLVVAIANVVAHISGVISDIASTFMLGLESISQIVGGAMTVIQGIFTGNWDLILTGVRTFQTGLLGLITAIGQGIINFFNLTFGTVIAAVSGFISGVIEFFKNLKNTLVGGSIVQEMMDLMLQIIDSGVAAIIGVFAGMVSDVISTVSGLADALYDLGASIMDSLKSGIMSKVASIISAVKRAIQDIIDAAKGALGALSESRVFMDIGKDMMEGMAVGIAGHGKLPAMAAASAAVSTAWTVNNYYNMTVNTRATRSTVIQDFQTLRALQ